MCGRPGIFEKNIFFSAGEKRFFERIEPKKKIESKNIYSSEPKFYQELKSALKSTFWPTHVPDFVLLPYLRPTYLILTRPVYPTHLLSGSHYIIRETTVPVQQRCCSLLRFSPAYILKKLIDKIIILIKISKAFFFLLALPLLFSSYF